MQAMHILSDLDFICMVPLNIFQIKLFFSEEEDALLPYLGAEDVLDEIVTLLARLENDRMEILKSLVHEKEKVVRLNEKIDHLCLVRMRELPIAVQKGKIYLYIVCID